MTTAYAGERKADPAPVPRQTIPSRPARRRAGLRSLLPYLRAYRYTLLVVAALSLVEAVGTLGQPLLTRNVLDRIDAEQAILGRVAMLVGLLLLVAVVGGFRDYLLQRTAEGMVLTTRRRLVTRLLRLPIAAYDQRRTGDLLSRVGADTTLLRAVVASGLVEAAAGMVVVAGAAVSMLLLDPLLFAVTAVGLGSGVAVVLGLARRVQGASRRAQDRVGTLTAAVERALSAARTIRASGAEEREAETIDHSAQDVYAAGLRIARLQSLIGPITSTTIQGAFLMVLGLGGARVASGVIEVADLVAFILFLFMLWFPLGRALNAYARLQTGLGALHRIEEILDLAPEPVDAPVTAGGTGPAVAVRERDGATSPATVPSVPAIEFDQVGFSYPGGGPVLRDISFTVPQGARVALVGPSGAGKSTLLALVERFYEVTSGAVRVEGVDIRELTRSALRRRLGYVEQEAPVLAGTLRDNLALAAPTATEEDMLQVLRRVNLFEAVSRTPLGLDAQVGEGGVLLSGGERQRLALARTFLAAPPVMLLDEATSNLDSRNEAAMREAVSAVAADRTLLVVAHRLSTVVDSDQIVVVEQGRVVATGRHQELTGSSPLYRELAAHQLLIK